MLVYKVICASMILPIVVTLVGIVIDVSPVHPWKATSPNDRISNDDEVDNDDDCTNTSNTSRNSN